MEEDSRNARVLKFAIVAIVAFSFLPLKANSNFMAGNEGLFFLMFIFVPPLATYLITKGPKKYRSFYAFCWLGFFLPIVLFFFIGLVSMIGL